MNLHSVVEACWVTLSLLQNLCLTYPHRVVQKIEMEKGSVLCLVNKHLLYCHFCHVQLKQVAVLQKGEISGCPYMSILCFGSCLEEWTA